ncbi:MAG: TonB-dependent receptor, partial [Hyphomonadaceae bacterium]
MRVSLLPLLAGTAVFVCANSALAQSGEGYSQPGITVIGQRPAYREDETATATRTPTPLRDVPQSVSVITSDVIEDQGMRSMADVVRYVPGVSMGQGEGHRDAPTLRGNSSTADFFVDGVRDDVQYYRDLYNAERIEVLKGPNAMIFGRGGGGGVINRVTEWANWSPVREVEAQLGAFEHYRIAADLGGVLNQSAAARLNAMYEDAQSYRDFVTLERYGVNPTTAFRLSPDTQLRLGYEYFSDERTVDRGVPSQNGRPFDGGRSLFFGNPDASQASAEVNALSATIEHAFGPNLRLRNHTLYGDYEKAYANVFAGGAVNGAGNVALSAYASGTERQNLFNQTDLVWETRTGGIAHTILAGAEFGRQETANTRSPTTAPGIVNVTDPTVFGAYDFGAPLLTDNHVDVDVMAFYLQDQIELTPQWRLLVGARYDRFDLSFDDRRPGAADFEREDSFVSPRLGVIYKPIEPVSIYASYAVSYLPQSGDQFASLSANSAALEPEEFENVE